MNTQPSEGHTSLLILGSTGSIGVSTLDIVRQYPERFQVLSLSANKNHDLLWRQCLEFKPKQVAIVDSGAAAAFQERWQKDKPEYLNELEIKKGADALVELASEAKVDSVMAAIVGSAGLEASITAARLGKRILLANKESLVMAGELFKEALDEGQAELLPIDSEHNAIFQCLPISRKKPEIDASSVKSIKRVILTASGGPFWQRDKGTFDEITPEQACAHPKWDMGRKISVDSATLMNKGLEVIEACLLFGLPPEQVEVIIHPQSIVHSMVEYIDGSVIAELANPDMKIPIAYGMAWPERVASGVDFLDLVKERELTFAKPDMDKFPCLALAYRAASTGQYAVTALNAANEIAVEAFLDGTLSFNDIPKLIEHVLEDVGECDLPDLDAVMLFDHEVRVNAKARIGLL